MSFGVVFPGQGSQRVGMLEEAAGAFSIVGDTFSEASDALEYDLWHLVSQGPVEKLGLTEYTQPAILTASVALYRAFSELVAWSCNPATWRSGLVDGLRAGSLLVAALCRSGVRAKPGVDMVGSGEPRPTRLSKEGRTGPGWKHSRQKAPRRAVVG